MMRLHDWTVGFAAALAAMGSATASAQERISVEQAVALALKQNLRLLASQKRSAASHETAAAAFALMLPSLRLTDAYQHWNCPAAFQVQNFAAGTACLSDIEAMPMPAPDLSAFTAAQQAQLGALVSSLAAPVVERKQNTNLVAATAHQPLVGLFRLGYDFSAARASALASDEGVKVSEAALTQAVRTGFLRHFAALAEEQIAAASAMDLRQEVEQAQARLKADVITRSDLLRVQVSEADAEQRQIAARTQATVIKANLLDALGLQLTQNVELVEPAALMVAAKQPLPALDDATKRAQQLRPEMAEAQLAAQAAHHAGTARYLTLLPEVDFEGGYLRTDGQLFAPGNQWFLGVLASWDIWDWGGKYHRARAAISQAGAADIDLDDQRRTVALEVKTALARMEAASASVTVAESALASAQEAYRETREKVSANTATTTDLLDAQAALTRARLNLSRAKYELAIEHVALLRATGE